MAWLVLTRTTEGFEDLIEEEVQSGKKDFTAVFKIIHHEFNRVTTSNLNALNKELFNAKMDGAFAADLLRKSNKIEEIAPGNGFTDLQLLTVFMEGLPMEYKELVQHLRFRKVNSLKSVVDQARDFAVANHLENEAGISLSSTAPRKVQQVFSMTDGAGVRASDHDMQCAASLIPLDHLT